MCADTRPSSDQRAKDGAVNFSSSQNVLAPTVSCKTRGIYATRSTNTSQTGLGVFCSVLDNHASYLPDSNTVGLGKIARVFLLPYFDNIPLLSPSLPLALIFLLFISSYGFFTSKGFQEG